MRQSYNIEIKEKGKTIYEVISNNGELYVCGKKVLLESISCPIMISFNREQLFSSPLFDYLFIKKEQPTIFQREELENNKEIKDFENICPRGIIVFAIKKIVEGLDDLGKINGYKLFGLIRDVKGSAEIGINDWVNEEPRYKVGIEFCCWRFSE